MKKKVLGLIAILLSFVLMMSYIPSVQAVENVDQDVVEEVEEVKEFNEVASEELVETDQGKDIVSSEDESKEEKTQDVINEEADIAVCDLDIAVIDAGDDTITNQEAFLKAIQDGKETITVSAPIEITVSTPLVIKNNVTISMNDKGSLTLHRDVQTHSIFQVGDGASLTLNDVKMTGNNESNTTNKTNRYVSPIITDGTLTLNHTQISGFVSAHGGAITINKGNTTINDGSVLENNQACYYSGQACGGAIDLNVGTLTINGGTFKNNKAQSSWLRNGGLGGVICASAGAKVIINNGTFESNEAGQDESDIGVGGVLFIGSDSSLIINDGTFSKNKAIGDRDGRGGVVYISGTRDGEPCYVNGGNFFDNYALKAGGAFYVDGHRVDTQVGRVLYLPTETAVYQNTVSLSGGGIWLCEGGDAILNGNQGYILNNKAESKGDDVFCTYPYSEYGYTKQFKLYSRLADGSHMNWYEDDDSKELIPDIYTYILENVNTKNLALRSDQSLEELDTSSLKVKIYNNDGGDFGGGIACNGSVVIGDQEPMSLTVHKVWVEKEKEEHKDIVVLVKNENGKVIDELTLNNECQWTYTITDLPKGTYTVEEKEKIEGYQVSYTYEESRNGDVNWTITNTKEEPKTPPSETPPTTPSKPKVDTPKKSVKTGDEKQVLGILGVFLITGLAGLFVLRKKIS